MRTAYKVVGMAYGDEGKGKVVDWLCRTRAVGAVVRFSGGPQAAHTVVTEDGRTHQFAQWGSGTFRGVPTFHGPDAWIEPLGMAREAEALQAAGVPEPWKLLRVHEDCGIVTPYHAALGRLRELARGNTRHGSCGTGHGEAVRWREEGGPVLRAKELSLYVLPLTQRLWELREYALQQSSTLWCQLLPEVDGLRVGPDDLAKAIFRGKVPDVVRGQDSFTGALRERTGDIVLEGTQGALLDQDYGFHPYTTWAHTFNDGGLRCVIRPCHEVTIGVVRTYGTRHGPGPFPAEDAVLTKTLPEQHNVAGTWNGAMRVGWFDRVAFQYAMNHVRPTVLALTHADAAAGQDRWVTGYYSPEERNVLDCASQLWDRDLHSWEQLVSQSKMLLGARPILSPRPALADLLDGKVLGAPVVLLGTGPRAQDMLVLRDPVRLPFPAVVL